MRWVGVALVLASIPVFITLLQSGGTKRRDLAVLWAGILMFCTGSLEISQTEAYSLLRLRANLNVAAASLVERPSAFCCASNVCFPPSS